MNESIFETARELGQLIKESEIFTVMRRREEAASSHKDLTALSGEYEVMRLKMQEMTLEENPNYEEIGALSRDMEAVQDRMLAMPEMKQLQEARAAFTELMNVVNRELQSVLAPETVHEGGCSGSCAGCSGCH